MNAILSVLISAIVSIGSFLGLHQIEQQQPVSPQVQQAIKDYVAQAQEGPIFGTAQPIAGSTYTLAGAGVSQTGTSITLSSFTVTQNGYKITDSDLSDTFYITLEPGNPAKQEIVSCTTDTQNANNTATFTGCTRGLSPIQPYTASSTLRFSHGGGTQVIFSNPPQFYNDFAIKQNSQTITGQWIFDDNDSFRPRIDADTDTAVSTAFVTLGQLSRQAISGAANASQTVKGIVEIATPREVASSTATGGTSAILAVAASTATDTPSSVCSGTSGPCLVMNAYGRGTISQSWLDIFGTANTWTQPQTFGSTTSQNATTTNLAVTGRADFTGATLVGIAKTASTTTFIASGTYTKTSAAKWVQIELWGAGGGGGGIDGNGASQPNYSGGGGGGAYCKIMVPASALGSTETITLGTGGTGGVAGVNNGNVGGSTTFGSHLTCFGGGGGFGLNGPSPGGGAGGGGGGNNAAGAVGSTSTGGAGGGFGGGAGGSQPSTSDGGAGGGGDGSAGQPGFYGGGGGGGGHDATARAGGASKFGGGGGAAGPASGGVSKYGGNGGGGVVDATGANGTQPGGGGQGGGSTTNSNFAGGDGALGQARITEFF